MEIPKLSGDDTSFQSMPKMIKTHTHETFRYLSHSYRFFSLCLASPSHVVLKWSLSHRAN